jgi:cell division protein FtsX
MAQLADILIMAFVFYVLYKLFNKDVQHLDNVVEEVPQAPQPQVLAQADAQPSEQAQVQSVIQGPSEIKPDELLPKYDDANEFAKQNPVSKLLKEQNFLVSGYHVGINTVMQSNKIPYHDLRSAPPIPKEDVSPFNNSSYETPVGANRRHFEVGA